MLIRKLNVDGVRNLQSVRLDELASVNVLFGDNGAGKTSVLEAIYLLSSAKTFRSHKIKPLINTQMDNCVVYGEVVDESTNNYQSIAVQRFTSVDKPGVIKVAGESVGSASVLAERLPVQVVSSETFKLLEGAPTNRRQFLDWGVFHVEHRFLHRWKSLQRSLKQRNSLLRHGKIEPLQLAVWDEEFVQHAEAIDAYRAAYFQKFKPLFEQLLGRLIRLEGEIAISYRRGWDKDSSLSEILSSNRERELEKGYTVSGPHRADLQLRYQGGLASDILSRGQQKLVVCALRIAQAALLAELKGRHCLFLVDDLPAELDADHRRTFCELLEGLGSQVFVSCVDSEDLRSSWSDQTDIRMFHVEQGSVSPVSGKR